MVKISALPPGTTPIAGTEPVPIVQSGVTVRVPASAFANSGAAGAGYNGTSTTSMTIGVASQSFTTDVNLAYVVGNFVLLIKDPSNYMYGTVTSYSSTTGAMVVNVTSVVGSGTYSSWSITLTGSSSFASSSFSIPGVWFDIRDYGDISSGDITTALQATINTIGAGGRLKTIMIPQVEAISTMTQGAITIPNPSGDPGWTFIYGCKRIQITSPITPPMGTTFRGAFGSGVRGQGPGALGPNGPHLVGDSISAGNGIINITNVGSIRIDNLTMEPGGGASYSVYFYRGSGLLITNCSMGGCSSTAGAHIAGQQPAILIDGSIWVQARDCRFGSEDGSSPVIWARSTDALTDQASGLLYFDNITTSGGGFKFGPLQFGTGNSGDFHINGCLFETSYANSSLIELDSTYVSVRNCTFSKLEGADSLGILYTLKNTGTTTIDVTFRDCGSFSMDPASTMVNGLNVIGGVNAGGGGSNKTQIPTYNQKYGFGWPATIDQKLVATPRGPQWTLGTILNVGQDGSTGSFNFGTSLTTGILAPDGTTNAFSLTGSAGSSIYLYAVNRTVAIGDWFIFGCWVQEVDTANSISAVGALAYDLAFGGNTHGTDSNNGGILITDDCAISDGAWKWICVPVKLLSIGSGLNPCNVRFVAHPSDHAFNYFNPCIQYISVSTGFTDGDVMNYARSLKGGWATQNNVDAAGQVGILDHQTFRLRSVLHAATPFASLPTATTGMVATVSNSSTTTFGVAVGGTGASNALVWYNGTNWTVIGA